LPVSFPVQIIYLVSMLKTILPSLPQTVTTALWCVLLSGCSSCTSVLTAPLHSAATPCPGAVVYVTWPPGHQASRADRSSGQTDRLLTSLAVCHVTRHTLASVTSRPAHSLLCAYPQQQQQLI